MENGMDEENSKFGGMTIRQLEVWSLVAQGRTDKDIAYRLGISITTLRQHIRALMKRMGLRNRVELALDFYPINWRKTDEIPQEASRDRSHAVV